MFVLVCIIEELTWDSVLQCVFVGCHTDGSDEGQRREDMKTIGDERMFLLFELLFSRLHINIDINAALWCTLLGTSSSCLK